MNKPESDRASDDRARRFVLHDLIVPVLVAGLVGFPAGWLGMYVTQQTEKQRLTFVETKVSDNRQEISNLETKIVEARAAAERLVTASRIEASEGLTRLADRVGKMAEDVSWIRGRLESRPATP